MGTIVELASFQAKRIATENLLDLADLVLASNGMGLNYINRKAMRGQLKDLSDPDAHEHMQRLVNGAIERVYGEYAPEFIKPLSHYESDLGRYQSFLRSLTVPRRTPELSDN
ncbi:hypothetical protein ACB288_23440 [Aeromonas taiwanensis]|jgi:hypothetical protein|uniref:Uncharacterized protein n=1 Tax=Aeromonas bestiarum TaxID=105751 RepID=A0AAW7IEY6_9GAMM|nr:MULTISPECIES: hypothetical protein [Aeromonas]MCE9968113.1 hypothetical protein [Aeromonas salmonicida]MDM5069299.1 hypothetical protein [Aeromonas salmonicida]MDM5115869.1 hypothetical protein [Aeromonas salmonicida]MDM5142047.1 hypothetical protein [Aeromonas bestiarum]